jgi:hypothetical protein
MVLRLEVLECLAEELVDRLIVLLAVWGAVSHSVTAVARGDSGFRTNCTQQSVVIVVSFAVPHGICRKELGAVNVLC